MPDIGVVYTGPVFSAHNPQWAWSPNSGEGARLHGGRFNPIGVTALYTSVRELTAIREASPIGQPMQPLTLCQYEVDCDRLFDTRDPQAMVDEGMSNKALSCLNWEGEVLNGNVPSSHEITVLLIRRGYRGLIVSSFAQGATEHDINVVFWSLRDTPPDKVLVIDTHSRLSSNGRL